MKRPFVVNVANIQGSVGLVEEVDLLAELEELQTSGSSVPSGTPVSFIGAVEAIDGGLVAAGAVKTSWEGECRRCLGTAVGEVNVAVREVFELNPTEGETYAIKASSVDLELMIREAVTLELPVAALCGENCKGLCGSCGANLNEKICDCKPDTKDPRWSALDSLKE